MTVFGIELCNFREDHRLWVDRDDRHLDVFVPLPFDHSLWIYYTRDPAD